MMIEAKNAIISTMKNTMLVGKLYFRRVHAAILQNLH